ncbi:MAG: branched-chain amino acid ABC transporter permease [Gammaproteobacteria bacterium]
MPKFLASETTVALLVFAVLAALPQLLSGYPIYILPQYLLFGVMAMSLGLLWGFVGILSFGQAAFFAIGAYTMGLAMQHELAINAGYVALILSLGIGALLAAVSGYFLFSAGVRATYFVLVTLALSILCEQITVSYSDITGGWNGLFINRMDLTLGPWGVVSLAEDGAIYYLVLAVVVALYFLLRGLIGAKFGKVLVGIRENEDRMVALGFNVTFYKTAAFAISGALACLAGALYGAHANFVAPSLAGVQFSTEVVVWVAIGGRNSLLGALVGGVIVSSISNYLNSVAPQYWQLILGLIFIAVIVYFKGGLAGAATRFFGPRPVSNGA